MTQPVKKTDTHAVVPAPAHGASIFSIINRATGEEVNRVEGYSAAVAEQAKQDALAKLRGV